MTEMWLLLALQTIASGQIIYPDQYEMMSVAASHTNPTGSLSAVASQLSNNSQPAQIEPYFNQQPVASPLPQASHQMQHHPTTPHAEFYPSISPTANPESLLENWNHHVNDIIARGIIKFSLDLNRAIHNTQGTSVTAYRENAIFSPLSIGVALSLILLGSAGMTFDEVTRVLGLQTGVDISQHSEIVHQVFGQLLTNMNYRVEGSNMPLVNSASGIFVQEGYPIRSEFRAVCENAYKSEVVNLNFRRNNVEAQTIINDWVKQRTMGKINGILDQAPDPSTAVILLSALYFKGEWNQHFLRGMTERRPFYIEPNEEVKVDMMYNGGNFNFYEDKALGVKIMALPYKGLEMSMYVLLPKAEGAAALRDFRDQLTAENIENLISNLKNETCIIGFPRMKISSNLRLNSALQSMGLNSLFNPTDADLSIVSSGYGQGQASPVSPIPHVSPQTLHPILPPALPTALPQRAPQAPRQISPEQLASNTDEYLIFSRAGESNPGVTEGVRKNFFRYDDKKLGITVEQWNTGFHVRRTQRDVLDGRQRNDNEPSSSGRIAKNHDRDRERIASRINGDENARYASSQRDKYRYRDNVETIASRGRRQSRPIDENFLRFMQSKGFPSYGLDNLRNSGNLVNPGLFASDVLHKVEMEVTEKGTEAAATTAVSLRRDGNQKRLIANRPFLFFIRHNPTKLILFWGTVNTPNPHYAVVR